MATENIKNVTYKNLGWDSSADIYVPPNFDEKKKYPALVSTHPIGSCKEQTAGNVYAAALAKEGFVVLAFDASFQGASGGVPRFIEDPSIRSSDIRFAIDYLVTVPYIDENRIGAIGVCGGGGYTIHAAITDHRIKALTSITGVNFGRLIREGFSNFDPVGALERMGKQRTAEALGAERNVINYLPPSVEQGKRNGITDIDVLEATDYYKTPRSQKSHGATSGLFSFNSAAMGWDAFLHAEVLLTQPLMVVIGDKPGGFGAYRDGGKSTTVRRPGISTSSWLKATRTMTCTISPAARLVDPDLHGKPATDPRSSQADIAGVRCWGILGSDCHTRTGTAGRPDNAGAKGAN